jgi:hypothetical protein
MTIEELVAYVEADPMRQANTDAHNAVMAALYVVKAAMTPGGSGSLVAARERFEHLLRKAEWR